MSARPTRSPAIIAHSCALVATEGAYVRPVGPPTGHRAAWRRPARSDGDGVSTPGTLAACGCSSPSTPPHRRGCTARTPRPTSHDLRWTTPDQWHVTVRFLVTWKTTGRHQGPRSAAGAGRRRCDRSAHGAATAWFPGRRILHAPVTGLESVAKEVERLTAAWATARCSRSSATSPWRARAEARPGPGLAGAILQGKFDVRRVVLYASTLARRSLLRGSRRRAPAGGVHVGNPKWRRRPHIAERPLGTEVKGRSQGRANPPGATSVHEAGGF